LTGATVKGKVTKPAIDKQRRITIACRVSTPPKLHNGQPLPDQKEETHAAQGRKFTRPT